MIFKVTSMKKYKLISAVIISLFSIQLFDLTAFANSSWVWISETRPYDVLPWVAIGTLIIETISLIVFAKIKNGFKVFSFVTVANLLSFAAPYLFLWLVPNEVGYTFEMFIENTPSYTIGVLYYITTILIELPVVYFSLRKNAVSGKKFIITIIVSNIVTTILVAIIERIFCVGRW